MIHDIGVPIQRAQMGDVSPLPPVSYDPSLLLDLGAPGTNWEQWIVYAALAAIALAAIVATMRITQDAPRKRRR
jgi:hypothetical protein